MWLIQYAAQHWGSIVGFGGLVVTSGIKTMPPPDAPFNLREWVYDWSHQFFNLPNNRLMNRPNIDPPSPEAK